MQNVTQAINQVSQLVEQGQVDHAKKAFRQLPFGDVESSEDFMRFGLLALQLGFVSAAVQVFQLATEKYPDNAVFWNNLGTAHLKKSEWALAQIHYERAIELKAEYPLALFNLGIVCERLRQWTEAKGHFQKALSLESSLYQAHVRLAILAEQEADVESLTEHAAQAYALNPNFADSDFVQSLAFAKKQDFEKAVEHIDQAIEKLPQGMNYRFHKGRLLEKLEDYNKALATFTEANQMARPDVQPIAQKFSQDFQNILQVYGKVSKPLATEQVPAANDPVFLLNLPRSGGTLLCHMLASHPEVSTYGEFALFERVYAAAAQFLNCGDNIARVVEELWVKDNAELLKHLQAVYQEQLIHVQKQAAGKQWVDKGIMNTIFLPLIAKVAPRARLVHILRDGRETAFSLFKHHFEDFHWYKYGLEDAIDHWIRMTTLVQVAEKSLGLNIVTTRYEDLVVQPEDELKKVLQHLGLEWDEACLEYYKNDIPVYTASYAQVKEPLSQKSLHHVRDHYPQIFEQLTQRVQSIQKLLNQSVEN